MKKLLILFTGILTSALLLGNVFYPDFPLTWMAADDAWYIFLRGAIVVALTVLIFREVVGLPVTKYIWLAGAAGLYILMAALLFTDNLRPADAAIFAETAIILSLEFLEAPLSARPAFAVRPVGKFGVGNDFVKIG